MTMPNFLIVGAQKAGTTSLYHYLGQHPEVYVSPVKEPHFFNNEGGGRVYAGPYPGPARRITTVQEYEKLFDGVSDEKAVGEASPSYLYLPEVPGRIRRRIPEAKLIAVLRDPVERAYSAYLHTVRTGREPLEDFREALRDEERRIREGWHHLYHYRNRGYYHEQLGRYYEAFGRERLRVYLHEELNEDPAGIFADAFRFLGVDDTFVPDTSTRYNPSGVPRNRATSALVSRLGALTPAAKRLLPFGVRQSIKGRIFAKAPPLDPRAREELLEAYRGDVLALQKLIGRDLSGWLTPSGTGGGATPVGRERLEP